MRPIEKFRLVFSRFADRPCLLAPSGTVFTYGEIERLAAAWAVRFIEAGLKPGDVVAAICRENSVDLAILMLGAWTAGCTVAPVNGELSATEIRSVLANARPRMIWAPGSDLERLGKDALDGAEVRVLEEGNLNNLGGPNGGRMGRPDAPNMRIFERLLESEPFLIIYTAGSTGAPKGVQITPGALLANERLFCTEMRITAENRFYNILPMSYLGGIHNLLLLPMTVGASIVVDAPLGVSNLFLFWRRVRQLQIDTLWLTSAMLAMLLKLPAREDESWIGSQVRLGLVGMAPLQPEVRRRFETRFGFELHQNYALSETLFLTSQRPGRKLAPGGCGQLLPGVTIMIRDRHRNPVPESSEGELHIETPHMMYGYRNATPEDAAALDGGVFRSGDLGFFDENGELQITGRIKDLIIRGGLNISAAAIEALIVAYPGVAEASVIGVPDPIYGEEVAAIIVPQESALSEVERDTLAHDVLAYASRELPVFQRPKTCFVWSSLPRNHANKIDKPGIRKRLAEERRETGSAAAQLEAVP